MENKKTSKDRIKEGVNMTFFIGFLAGIAGLGYGHLYGFGIIAFTLLCMTAFMYGLYIGISINPHWYEKEGE